MIEYYIMDWVSCGERTYPDGCRRNCGGRRYQMSVGGMTKPPLFEFASIMFPLEETLYLTSTSRINIHTAQV